MALEALTRIGQLYAIEQQGKALDIDARQLLRAEQSRPALDALHQWLTQTLLGTAKLNGIDPAAWLRDTLEKLPTWPNSRIDELLPFARPVE